MIKISNFSKRGKLLHLELGRKEKQVITIYDSKRFLNQDGRIINNFESLLEILHKHAEHSQYISYNSYQKRIIVDALNGSFGVSKDGFTFSYKFLIEGVKGAYFETEIGAKRYAKRVLNMGKPKIINAAGE